MDQSENTSLKSGPVEVQLAGGRVKESILPRRPLWRGGKKLGKRMCYPLSTKTRTGVSWQCMMNRCYNTNVQCYSYYGGVGIYVCAGIQRGPHILAELIGLRPIGMSIDRIENNGSYTCGKCNECTERSAGLNIRWATPHEQRMNQKRTKRVAINGVEKSYEEWAIIAGVPFMTFYGRVHYYKWTGSRLLQAAIDPREGAIKRFITVGSETKCMTDWGRDNGISPGVIWGRLKRGWTAKQAVTTPPLKPHERINELEKKI